MKLTVLFNFFAENFTNMKKKVFKVKTLIKFAESINKDFEILYSKQDGYWLITDEGDIYIGADSQGAMFRLEQFRAKKK